MLSGIEESQCRIVISETTDSMCQAADAQSSDWCARVFGSFSLMLVAQSRAVCIFRKSI